MMAEVSQHTGEVEACDPFPGVLLLARAVRFAAANEKTRRPNLGNPGGPIMILSTRS